MFEVIEILYRFGGADFEQDKWVVVSCLAKLAEPHSIGTVCNHPHVFDDLLPSSKFLVFTDAKAQELLGRGDVCGCCGSELNISRDEYCKGRSENDRDPKQV